MIIWLALVALAADPVAVSVGDCARALASAAVTDGDRLAHAWCAARRGLPVPSAPAVAEGQPLYAWAVVTHASALAAAGRVDDANAWLARLPTPWGAWADDAAEVQTRIATVTGAATPWMREHAADPATRWALGEAARVRGDVGEATKMWLSGWSDASPGGHDARSAASLEALGVTVTDLKRPDIRAAAQARVTSLDKARRDGEAYALLLQLGLGTDPQSVLRTRRLATEARAYADATAIWAQLHGPPETAVGPADDLFEHALALARQGDYAKASLVYRRLIQQHSTSTDAEFARFKLGYMAYDAGDCDAAVPLLAAHIAAHPTVARVDESLWFSARCRWRQGRTEEAEGLWRRLIQERPKSSLVAGSHYWLARAKGRRGDAAGERAALQVVLDRWPESSWGWFASQALGVTYAPRAAPVAPAWPATLAARDDVRRGRALLDAGLVDAARREFARVPTPADVEGRLALGWARFSAGDLVGGRALVDCKLPAARAMCVARPASNIVEPILAAANLHPSLAYAIMLAESGFDPSVTSPVGARGLMQLMPALGASLAESAWPGTPFETSDLYRTPTNAFLGATELASLAERLDGRIDGDLLPAIIAAYNGGAPAVMRWTEGTPPPDEFAEDISFTETRRYVRTVLGALMAQRRAWGDPPASAPTPGP